MKSGLSVFLLLPVPLASGPHFNLSSLCWKCLLRPCISFPLHWFPDCLMPGLVCPGPPALRPSFCPAGCTAGRPPEWPGCQGPASCPALTCLQGSSASFHTFSCLFSWLQLICFPKSLVLFPASCPTALGRCTRVLSLDRKLLEKQSFLWKLIFWMTHIYEWITPSIKNG